MKSTLKPLGIAVATATAAFGYGIVANAQTAATPTAPTVASTELGDLALVPYYTVRNGFITGLHIVNTSSSTQVVKIRLRRAEDSMDALDWNVVLSPQDVYAGFISESNGEISFSTSDTSCTAPAAEGNRLVMPSIYREGAEEGYIEVISMAQPINEQQPIAIAAKHVNGVPRDCEAVRSNFFANTANNASGSTFLQRGVINNALTHQTVTTAITQCTPAAAGANVCQNNYTDSSDALKVSYFIRSTDSGIEMGNAAVHVAGFSRDPMMTNQQRGFESGDMQGFNFPDLDGGAPVDLTRGKFNTLRSGSVLGVAAVANEWSSNAGVNTDWVVTLPGQYTMLDLPQYYAAIIQGQTGVACTIANGCDNRDIPLNASYRVYDREEGTITVESGGLVVSPTPPVEFEADILPNEVNVIEWGDSPVLGADAPRSVSTPSDPFGWASLAVSSDLRKPQRICDWPTSNYDPTAFGFDAAAVMTCNTLPTGSVPMVGFTAWARSFEANPASNYGRIIEHSYTAGSAS